MLNNLLKLWHAISGWWESFTTWLHALIGDIPYLLVSSTFETLYMTLTATAFAFTRLQRARNVMLPSLSILM